MDGRRTCLDQKSLFTITSNNLPVCMDHTNISNTSSPPAHTISPLLSTVKHENCTGRGDVNVRKLRYL
jgi:hypothetical protein